MKQASLRLLLAIVLFAATAPIAWAETLLIERARAASAQPNLPTRGQTSAQVEKKFGAPQEKLDPQGGQKRQWPVINRWVYPEFTVYFERQRVINVVLNAGSVQRIGGTGTGAAQNGWWDEQPATDTSDPESFMPAANEDTWQKDSIFAKEEDDWTLPDE